MPMSLFQVIIVNFLDLQLSVIIYDTFCLCYIFQFNSICDLDANRMAYFKILQ